METKVSGWLFAETVDIKDGCGGYYSESWLLLNDNKEDYGCGTDLMEIFGKFHRKHVEIIIREIPENKTKAVFEKLLKDYATRARVMADMALTTPEGRELAYVAIERAVAEYRTEFETAMEEEK
jgi:hypothetical protein